MLAGIHGSPQWIAFTVMALLLVLHDFLMIEPRCESLKHFCVKFYDIYDALLRGGAVCWIREKKRGAAR